ncbi:MAG: hypothetical protein QMD65_00205 [Patescibacteria group bacterium]|nr:hypothetical protein [Patescibacteria group bacterium]
MKPFLAALFIILIAFSFLPIITHGAEGTGIWASTTCAATSNTGGPNKPCSFCDALIVTKNIIDFLFKVAIPLAVAIAVYGAVMMMLAAGSEERVRKSKQIITRAFIGLAIALSAWVIINTFLHILTGQPDFPWATITC